VVKATKKTKNSPRVTSDAADDLIGQIVAAARATPPPPLEVEEEEEEEDEIHTREFSHQGTVYLIDDENSIYSYSTHEHIGSFDTITQTITLL
jgi:hypothetical protein